jgi:hypothetical protein
MPIYPVGTVKSVNSPYCIKDYKDINAEFATSLTYVLLLMVHIAGI